MNRPKSMPVSLSPLLTLLLVATHVDASSETTEERRLAAPDTGKITVGFLLSEGANVIDFAGPWEVFQDVVVPGRGVTVEDTHPFELITVAASREPIRLTGGLRVVPDVSFDDAPELDVIVIPAQGSSPEKLAWLEKASAVADMTMSVCTGAFLLARAGLLDGRSATTHHDSLDRLERMFPAIDVRRGVRYVEGRKIATAAGLTSGVDLALRIVERYFDRETAARTAAFMEHSGTGWSQAEGYWDDTPADAVRVAAAADSGTPPVLRGLDPVLLAQGLEVEGAESIWVERGGYRYAFENAANRERFLAEPERFEIQLAGACAFMASSGAPPGSGDPDRYLVHDQRVYIFASESCRLSFQVDPERYLR